MARAAPAVRGAADMDEHTGGGVDRTILVEDRTTADCTRGRVDPAGGGRRAERQGRRGGHEMEAGVGRTAHTRVMPQTSSTTLISFVTPITP